jgi:hypothetical protein
MQTVNIEKYSWEGEAKNCFEFGRNWQRFLRLLNQEGIEAAELSLRQVLDFEEDMLIQVYEKI